MADDARRREASDQATMLLWTDCYGVFASAGMNCSAALSLWRKCTLVAQFITVPDSRVMRGRSQRKAAWTMYSASLLEWRRIIPNVAAELVAVIPRRLERVLSAQTELMSELTVNDVVRSSRRARFTWEQSTTALGVAAQASVGVPVMEAWFQADDPIRIYVILDGHVTNQALPALRETRSPHAGRPLRDVREMSGHPLSMVAPGNLPLYPEYLLNWQ